MLPNPTKPEIDHRTLKLLVGLIALSLANLTSFFADSKITSISESYYEGGWAQSIFVGFLFAIAAFLLAYNGLSRTEMVLSKVAAVGALGVALFPCGCSGHAETVPHVHFASAAIMFLILAYFCYVFYKRARGKGHTEANRRAFVYAASGLAIIASILALVLDTLSGDVLTAAIPRLVFYCERAGLVAFGISWLTASRILPVLTRSDERFSLLGTASNQ
jgi:vacuolar-type H+-ATPase subunit I/STV1